MATSGDRNLAVDMRSLSNPPGHSRRLAEDDPKEGRVAVSVSDSDMTVVLADLADPPPVFVDQLQAVFRLPGHLALEREIAAPRRQRTAAGPPLRRMLKLDVLPDVCGVGDLLYPAMDPLFWGEPGRGAPVIRPH